MSKGISSIVVFIQLLSSSQGRANCRRPNGPDSPSYGILLFAFELLNGLPT